MLAPTLLALLMLMSRSAAAIQEDVAMDMNAAAASGLLAQDLELAKTATDLVATRRSAQDLTQVVSAIKAVITSVPSVLSKSPGLPSSFSADFGLFMNAAGTDGKFFITAATSTGVWKNDIIAAIGQLVPWLDIMDNAPAADEPGWLFRATIAVTDTSMGMRLATTAPLTIAGAISDKLGLNGLGIDPQEESGNALTSASIEIVVARGTGKIQKFAFAMGGGSFSIASLAAKLGLSVSGAATGITLSNPSLSIEVPDDATEPTNVEVALTVSGIPFLPGSTFDAVLVVQGSTSISIDITGDVVLFDGTCTANAFNLAVGSAARTLSASLTISCPDAFINGATASLTYDNGAISVVADSIFSYLDGALTINRITFSSGRNATYIAASASGGIANYVATVAFNVSRIPVNGKRPLSLSLSLPEANVGAVVRAIGPTADDLLPDFVKNVNLPSLSLSTWDKVTGTGNRTNLTSLYRVTVGPQSSTGIYADFVLDKLGILIANVTMTKSLDLGAAVTAALPGVTLPFDVSGIIIIKEPFISVVGARAPSRGVVPAGTKLGTVMGFGLQVPALLGDSMVYANMMLMDANKTRVGIFEIGWVGDFTPVQYVTLRGALLRIQSGSGVIAIANGTLVTVDVAVVLQISPNKQFNLTAEARNVQVAQVLKTLFPSTPDLIVKVLDPVRFSYIAIGYDSVKKFTCEASPDLTGVPGLRELIQFLGFKQEDIKIRPKLNELAIEIAIIKTWELNLGSPFVGKSLLSFALALSQSGANTQFAASADFSAQLQLSFLEPEVIWFSLGATVAYDSLAPPPSVSFSIRAAVAATGNPFYIKGFSWIKIAYLGGEIGLTPMTVFPFVSLYKINFNAKGIVLSTNVEVAVLWDQPKADFGILFAISNFDLQGMLNEMGIRASLGPFNIQISSAKFSFARQTIALPSGTVIPQGLKLSANMTFLSIFVNFDVSVDTTGFELQLEVRDVLKTPIFDAIFTGAQAVLDALKINIKLREQIRIDLIRVGLVLKTTRVAFRFGVKAYIFGVTIDFDINLDTAAAPWDVVVKTLQDKFIEPITAACTKDSYVRGSGFVDRCPAGRERQGDFCYNNCPTDWQYGATGKLNICYQNCPPGYRDDGVGGTGLTCSQVACNADQIWDGALLCWNGCAGGYSYKATRCYKNCPSGWGDDAVGLSCVRNSCDGGDEDNGAGLCYPQCRSGYTSNKLTMCIQSSCPSGYRNDPLSCWRDVDIYGKGCCCVYFFGWRCCGCNGGYTDDGCTCRRNADLIWKSTYDRGVGYPKYRTYIKDSYLNSAVSAVRSFSKRTQWRDAYPMVCAPDKDYDGAALCYDKCQAGYTGAAFVCWQNCPSNKGLIDCGTYCAPAAAGSCANFIGATYQNCKNKYPTRRMVLDMMLSGNYTYEQMQAAADGDTTVFKGSAWDPKSVEIIHHTSHSGRDAASHAGLLHPETTRVPKTTIKVDAAEAVVVEEKTQEEEWEEVEVDHPHYAGTTSADSWQHVRIMHERLNNIDTMFNDGSSSEGGDTGVHVVRMLQSGASPPPPGAGCKPAATTPQCWCVGKAYGIYADPAGRKSRYLICAGDSGLLQTCPGTDVFSPSLKLCVSPSEAAAPSPPPADPNQKPPLPAKNCTGRDDGIYFQDSRDNTTAYKCDSGQLILDFCPDDYVTDETTGDCKIPDYKPPGQLAPCQDPDCFCSDKKKGNYTDVLRGNIKRYINCRGNKGRWRKCGKDSVFDSKTLQCGFMPPNATMPIKDCKDVDCFCVGRADGVYVNPWSNQTGINCGFQMPAIIPCSDGYDFVITKQPYCQPKDVENPLNLPPLPPSSNDTTSSTAPSAGGYRRNRRRGG
ncbi:hypothetical protein CHLRE_08g363100v5 [Chlamydomonas reinhardtii]|uniref:Chitin-binding type-2 domain-containing protein n=1 Tax=Chlamydomonas reinhardtii TaxID=3055 RepID=A0A2K3DGN6_CHLRE|nr:uncharacterized protein CHLRE_08g363100v5 [Chlamydomonas reinhardtii]PNW79689.1 hypothetical protein CHLRE_08g363100v5 [Chlamydomonas reinhardtii]